MSLIRTPRHITPGRRKNPNKENVYFEPGKFGRKTGITLRDTGVRDEFGFEPVSGIFSSPVQPSPKRSAAALENGADPEVLHLRKTPHLPPRSQTPRHTNIGGSPIRQSPGKGETRTIPLQDSPRRTPNRLLDFSMAEVVTSIEKSPSPVKTRSALATKTKKIRKSLFDFDLSPDKKKKAPPSIQSDVSQVNGVRDEVSEHIEQIAAEFAEEDVQESVQEEEEVAMGTDAELPKSVFENNDDYFAPMMDDDYPAVGGAEESLVMVPEQPDASNIKRKRERPVVDHLISPLPAENSSATRSGRTVKPVDYTLSPARTDGHSSSKRRRLTIDPTLLEEDAAERDAAERDATSELFQSKSSASPRKIRGLMIARDDDDSVSEFEGQAEETAGETAEPEEARGRGRPKKGARKSVTAKSGRRQSQQKQQKRPSDRGASAQIHSARDSERPFSPSRSDRSSTTTSVRRGPASLVELKEGTPFEDEGVKMTRSGRPSIKPLKFWQNESFVWRNGEVDGIVRAHEIEQPKRTYTKRRKQTRLGSIMEEEEAEDLLPEVWEDELGVINGPVRSWDAEIGAGSAHEDIDEDVAFAAPSITVRDVQGSAFRYAKVMTMDFFGAGMVEIPAQGYKRSKNSRKMQMIFFVHEGKVTVEVASMKFGLTKGGVFQVPRGNNYAITNESSQFPAKIFFAQGCEFDSMALTQESGPSAA